MTEQNERFGTGVGTVQRPDLAPLFRRDLIESLRKSRPSMSAADRRRAADELLEMARQAGLRMRRDRLWSQITALRADLLQRGRRGAYPKGKWAKLRRLEAAHTEHDRALPATDD